MRVTITLISAPIWVTATLASILISCAVFALAQVANRYIPVIWERPVIQVPCFLVWAFFAGTAVFILLAMFPELGARYKRLPG